MMLQTPVQPPARSVPGAVLLARRAKKGGAGMGQGYTDPSTGEFWEGESVEYPTYGESYEVVLPLTSPGTYMPPGMYRTSKGSFLEYGGGTSGELARLLAPVVPGVMNLVTAMYSPPAYRTVTRPGGSTTEIRVPGTVTGQPPQVAAGFSSTTIMVVVAAVVVVMMMQRGRTWQ